MDPIEEFYFFFWKNKKYLLATLGVVGCLTFIFCFTGSSTVSAQGPLQSDVKQAEDKKAVDKVFTPPAPVTMEQAPMTVATKAAKERIENRIHKIRDHLSQYQASFQSRKQTSEEFLKLADDLKLLIDQARADADLYRREAEDLVRELVFLEKGLRYMGDEVSKRSDEMKESRLQEMNGGAIVYDYQAKADQIPSRVALTEAFIKDMVDSGKFLSDANASLAIFRTYVLVTQAGSGPPKIDSERVDVLRQTLTDFVELVDKFTKQVEIPEEKKDK